jgi:hypothetical protein
MKREEKLELISDFESGYSPVSELIAGLGRDALVFVPPLRDAWSINDFLVHFLDADLSLAFRFRTAIAEPGKAVPVWEEEAWQERLHYDDEDGPACLELAKSIRGFVAVSLRAAVDADWEELFVLHAARGKMTLVDLIEAYRQHIVFHLPLIRRNMRSWEERKA